MTACKFAGRDLPRILVGRHDTACPSSVNRIDPIGATTLGPGPDATEGPVGPQIGAQCVGCQPCPGPHCRVCIRTHAEQTCPECVASTRDNLHAIARCCGALSVEVAHRGVNGEAMMLLGPSADPERWGFTEASVMVGRLPAGWVEDVNGELHPGFVLATWDMIWRDHLDQPSNLKATLPRLVDYLDQHLHRMAEEDLIPFEDFARDLRRCRGHLESVLHDQPRGDIAGVGCFECGHDLERRLTDTGFADVWTCRGCRQVYTSAEYNFALRASLESAKGEAS
jgi:ribosomal protein L37AE/L43A